MALHQAAVDVRGRSALQIAGMIQAGLADPERIAATTLAAIAAANEPGLFTVLTADRARAEAEESAARIRAGRPRGPLDGVPVAWKDLFDLEGEVTTAGSRVLATQPAARADAPVVRRLKAAGMVTVGRVGMTEFAFSALGLNPHYGTPRNARGGVEPRVPGGSSSGSAVAVARGLVPVSIGTDTGGSVRIPAAFNGIVGYKTTYGRYPMDGVFPLSTSFDSLGVLCRTVADAIAVDAAMRGRIASEVTRIEPQEARLIVPTNVVFDDAQPIVIERFESALKRLSEQGAVIDRRKVAAFDQVFALGKRHGAIVTAEAYALHVDRLNGPDASKMDPLVAERMRGGASISMVDFIALRDARLRLIAELRRDLGPRVMLAFPTVVHVAPALHPLETDRDLYIETNLLTLRNTVLGNFLELCSISLPCGADEHGLPIGFMLSAAGGLDADLLGLAATLENVVGAA